MTSPTLLRTPLHALHLEHGAKITPFAGCAMPLHYGGIIAEHLHVRKAAGLFDVSHMGMLAVSGGGAAAALEALMPADIISLPRGRQRYALLTNARGGIIDDLMVQNLGGHFMLVVNAACKQRDAEHLRAHLTGCAVEAADDALLALQGPAAAAALCEIPGAGNGGLAGMKFMDVRALRLDGIDCMVARSGYTGEDGFEVSLPAARAEQLARRLLANPQVRLAGLGARDSLRLEAGLCLYGSDITESTTPVEAGLGWAVAQARRSSGARAGGFPGDEVILPQLRGRAARRLVGLIPRGRAPVRAGAQLLAGGAAVGEVTSGGFGPSVAHPISIGYAQTEHAAIGAELRAPVRGRELEVTVAALPFVRHNFHR
ncbi:MAG: glycine cleavage system aminomethyltransferase GcvT [Gammaproteobacteria bacterium]